MNRAEVLAEIKEIAEKSVDGLIEDQNHILPRQDDFNNWRRVIELIETNVRYHHSAEPRHNTIEVFEGYCRGRWYMVEDLCDGSFRALGKDAEGKLVFLALGESERDAHRAVLTHKLIDEGIITIDDLCPKNIIDRRGTECINS
jgi:hypothetical protein